MWNFTIYLTHLANYLCRRGNKMYCTQCAQGFKNDRELDEHIRTEHRYAM